MLSEDLKTKSDYINFGSLISVIKEACEKESEKGKYEARLNILPDHKLHLTNETLLNKHDRATNKDSDHDSFIKELFESVEKLTGLSIKVIYRKRDPVYWEGDSEVVLLITWE